MNKTTYKILIFILISLNSFGQIIVKVNDKILSENQTVEAKEIKKLELNLSKPVILKPNSVGKARLYVELSGTDNKIIEGYTIEKESVNSVDAFLKDIKTNYVLYQDGGENKTFKYTMNAPPTLKAVLEQAGTNAVNKLVKVKVSLMFSDKTVDAYGVEHYGIRYDLIPVFQFNIKNEREGGTIKLLEIDANFSNSVGQQIKYVKQEKYKDYFYGDINPLINKKDITKCMLDGTRYLQIMFNIIDVNEKSQEQYINDLKMSLEQYLLSISNSCNNSISKNLPVAKYSDWEQVVPSNVNDKIIIPFLDGKNNKTYSTESIMKPANLGQLIGFKFNSLAIKAQCGYAFKEREVWGHVNVYFLKHPKNEKQVLMVFAFSQDSKETIETAKSVEDKIDLLLKSLIF